MGMKNLVHKSEIHKKTLYFIVSSSKVDFLVLIESGTQKNTWSSPASIRIMRDNLGFFVFLAATYSKIT